jgi:PKD repeat protein
MRTYLAVLAVLASSTSFAQALVSNFSGPSTACLQENIQLMNESENATRYEWDVCQGDLRLPPTAKYVTTIAGNVTTGIDLVFDGTNWFGFITSRETNAIKRLDFGSDINSIPTIVELGNIGNISPWRPIDIHIVHDNGEWFGFVYGESTNLITRIDFGGSLSNSNTLTSEVIITGNGNSNCGLDVVRNGNGWVILFSNSFSLGTAVLTTIRAIPTVTEKMQTANLLGVSGFGDVKLLLHNGSWYGYIPDYNASKFFCAKYGVNPLSTPVLTEISNGSIGSLSPYGVDIGIDQGSYIAFLCTLQGSLLRLDLGNDLDMPPVTIENLGNLSALGNTLKMTLVKEQTTWIAASLSWNGGELLRINFSNPSCTQLLPVLTEENPILKFTTSGKKNISLRAFNDLQFEDRHKDISISTLQAPMLDFANDGICLQTPVGFTVLSDQTITSANWDFGDGNLSAVSSPTNTFIATGPYDIILKAQAQNGCKNSKARSISIYSQPAASFMLPAGIVCTNNEFTFTNTTVDVFDGNLSYQWLVNTEEVSTARDLLFTFESGGAKDIILQASIPGCISQVAQTLPSIGEGPLVDFTVKGKCLNETISFTNNSSGAIGTYAWNFGNTETSSEEEPSLNYTTAGMYAIELEVTGTNTCVSKKIIDHQIYSVPQPNFTIDLPPFSCNGSSTNFADLTPVLIDSNGETWLWDFDDAGATSSNQAPQHTYAASGEYQVMLTLTSDQSCVGTVTKTISISEAPKPSIVNTPACENQEVVFSDASNVMATEWMWQVGDNFYFTENPSHIFAEPAIYSASLTLTATNGCIGTASKQIVLPQSPAFDFESEKKCVATESTFTALVTPTPDAVVAYSWQFDGNATTGNTTQYSFPTEGLHEVRLAVLTESGCEYTLNKAVTVLPAPEANFTFTPQSGQPPLLVQFTNQSNNASSFQWSFNDASNSISIEASPSFTFTELGNYPVDLLVSNAEGCKNTISKLVAVEVPIVSVFIRGLQIQKNADGTLQILVSIENVGNVAAQNLPIEVLLSNGIRFREVVEETIDRGQTVLHTFSTTIFKSSDLSYLCSSISILGNTSNGAQSICQALESFTVINAPYPNPATEELIIEWISASEEEVTLAIINQQGKEILMRTLSALPGLNQYQVNLRSIQSGFYLIKIRSSSAEQTFPTIISH